MSYLRDATRQQNRMNAIKRSDNTTGFKGVCFHKAAKKFLAQIYVNRRAIYLGLFDTAAAAARAYDGAARLHHGEFAKLNFQE